MMEKMIITKYGRVVDLDNVEKFFRKTVIVINDDEKPIALFALFALMQNDEIVNVGNFTNYDVAEIIEILLDIFADDEKRVFNVNLEENSTGAFLELLECATRNYYPRAVIDLKESLTNGELDVSFT